MDVLKIRGDFPILSQKIHGKDLVYLDNAATTQKPQQVLDAMNYMYTKINANIHRGVHFLSEESTTAHEDARKNIAHFIHAQNPYEIIFTRGTTESINLVASSFGEAFIHENDEILVTEMEHHSNFVPWQMLANRKSAKFKVLKFENDASISLEKLKSEVLSPDDTDNSFSLTDFSLQDFRIDLTNFIENNRQRLKDAPLGLYSLIPPLASKLSRVDKNLFNYKLESIIQPGVIFCLKHKHISKTNKKTLDKLNPISPYYLIYILESGDVRFNFTNSKQILDLYNLLCKGESQIYEQLCDVFNKEIQVPDSLNNYTSLLIKACNNIMTKTKSLNAQDLTKNRKALVLDQDVTNNYLNDFELITWLIIKEN